jgi:hypothetical protein
LSNETAVGVPEAKFSDDKAGWASRWGVEFSAAKKEVRDWHGDAERIVKRFLDERDGGKEDESRLNLFTANIQTIRAIMYGKVPTVTVTRRFNDATDDVARVAGVIKERLLNSDIERASDGYAGGLKHSLDDFLLVALGNLKARYVATHEKQDVPPIYHQDVNGQPVLDEQGQPIVRADGYSKEVKTHEDVESDYIHWRDQLWGPARIFSEVPWWAFRAQLTREALVEKFGKEVGNRVPLNSKKNQDEMDAKQATPWDRADVWEIWDKERKCVWFYVEGFGEVLTPVDVEVNENGSVVDPLGLEGFWPFPEPLAGNLTTSKFMPRPDFIIAQDLYNSIDDLTTRIDDLEEAVKVLGVYDNTSDEVKNLLSKRSGTLVPVSNWAMFAEKGGMKGAIDWFPLEMVVAAMDKLTAQRTEKINLLFQVTGMSDIVRGQAQTQSTATEQSIKAKFASVRLQALQDEFARFASDFQKIRGEIICKHFDPKTIYERSNIQYTPDAQLAPQAIALLKSDYHCYRVEVKPEAISLTDYAAVKQERTEVVSALGQFYQAMAPVMQAGAVDAQFAAEVTQWMIAGLKGGSSIEGVFDQMLARKKVAEEQAAARPPQPPPPDPKLQATQMKGQMDMQKAQFDHQASLQQIQAQAQADAMHQQNQTKFNLIESAVKERQKAVADVAAVTGQGVLP